MKLGRYPFFVRRDAVPAHLRPRPEPAVVPLPVPTPTLHPVLAQYCDRAVIVPRALDAGKGGGVVAAREYKRGQTILEEENDGASDQSRLWVLVDMLLDCDPDHPTRTLFEATRASANDDESWPPLFDDDDVEAAERIRQLHGSDANPESIYTLLSRCVLAAQDTSGRMTEGFYPMLARVNHSCDPNCFIPEDRRTTTRRPVARRRIRTGEALTFSYLREVLVLTPPDTHPRRVDFLSLELKQRQRILHTHARFRCLCTRCRTEK